MTWGGGCQMKDAEAVIGCREAKNTTTQDGGDKYSVRELC